MPDFGRRRVTFQVVVQFHKESWLDLPASKDASNRVNVDESMRTPADRSAQSAAPWTGESRGACIVRWEISGRTIFI